MRTRDENKEEAIRQGAIEMIAREGLDNFSVNKLARAAGVSPATLYIYYRDRDDLIVQLCQEVSVRMLETSLKDFDPDMHFDEGLRVQWINRLAHFTNYPLEVQFIEHVRYSPYYTKVAKMLNERFRDVMGKFVHNAIRRKELLELPFEVYWSVAFAPLYQLIKFHTQGNSMTGEKFNLSDELLMQTLKLVLKALKP
jgi:AcrR family transcriptional regulator